MTQPNSEMNEWNDERSLSESMFQMLEKEIMCDVTLRLGKEQDLIKAHKYMLASRSEVFHTMFEGSLPEKDEVVIPDVDLNTMKTLLRYIYTDVISVSSENVDDLLYVSEKYMLKKMKRECEHFLRKFATTEQATKVFQTAFIFNFKELQKKSLEYIEHNTTKCLSSELALSLSKECLGIILKSDYLSCTETDIFSFVLSWAEHACQVEQQVSNGPNLRNVIDDLLFFIRFPTIDMKFFSEKISTGGLLHDEEQISIYRSHFLEKDELFCCRPRCSVSNRKTYTLTRHQSHATTWVNDGINALCFQSNTDIWLKGVSVFNLFNRQVGGFQFNSGFHSTDYQQTLTFTIGITDSIGRTVLTQLHKFDRTSGNNGVPTTNVIFSEPLRIESNVNYTITMSHPARDTYYGTNCMESVSANDVTVSFKNSPASTAGTSTTTGQFASFFISV